MIRRTTATPSPPPATLNTLAFAILAEQARRIADASAGALVDRNPEFIHDLRVAIRRARYAIALFPVFNRRAAARALRERLGAVSDSVGPLRDLDVLLEDFAGQLERVGATPTDCRDVLACLEAMRDQAIDTMRVTLGAKEYRRTMTQLTALARTSAPTAAEEPVASFAGGVLQKAMRKAFAWKCACAADVSCTHLHQARIRLRRLRYACEFFRETLGTPADKAAALCIKLQDILGRHQDACASCALLTRAAADAFADKPGALLACGILLQVQRDISASLHADARKRWKKMTKRIHQLLDPLT